MEKIVTRTARIGLAAALLLGGATMAIAQNGPPTGGYPPARWNPNLYGYYAYPHRHYAYYPVYPTVAGYWDYYRGEVTTRSQLVKRWAQVSSAPRALGLATSPY